MHKEERPLFRDGLATRISACYLNLNESLKSKGAIGNRRRLQILFVTLHWEFILPK